MRARVPKYWKHVTSFSDILAGSAVAATCVGGEGTFACTSRRTAAARTHPCTPSRALLLLWSYNLRDDFGSNRPRPIAMDRRQHRMGVRMSVLACLRARVRFEDYVLYTVSRTPRIRYSLNTAERVRRNTAAIGFGSSYRNDQGDRGKKRKKNLYSRARRDRSDAIQCTIPRTIISRRFSTRFVPAPPAT